MEGFLCGLFSVEGSVKANRYLRLAVEMLEPKLIPAIHNQLGSTGYNPHLYRYVKNGQWAYGGLPGKRGEKLRTFLRSRGLPFSARKQPGGGIFRRL